MADSTLKKLLLKLGMDATDANRVIKTVQLQMRDMNKEAVAQHTQRLREAQAELAAVRVKNAQEKAASQQAILDNKVLVSQAATLRAEDIAKLAWKRQIAQQTQNEILLEKKKIAAIQAETAEIRKQLLLKREAAGAGGGHGGGGGVLGMFGGALARGLGGGLVGGVAAGVVEGGGILAIVNGVAHAMERFVDKLREAVPEIGPVQQLLQSFEKLSHSKGIDSTAFLDQLRSATKDLVKDTDLLRMANSFLQSGLKVTQNDVIGLVGATVNLARAQGRDATEATLALQRAFLTGRAQQLAYITGIQRSELQLHNYSRALGEATRRQEEFDKIRKVIENKSLAMGPTQITFTEQIRQFEVLQGRVFENMALGLVKSAGFAQFMGMIKDLLALLAEAEGPAKAVGEWVGKAAGVLAIAGGTIKSVTQSLQSMANVVGGILGPYWRQFLSHFSPQTQEMFKKFADMFLSWGYSLRLVAYTLIAVKGGFRELAAVVELLGNVWKHKFDPGAIKADLESFRVQLKKIGADGIKDVQGADAILAGKGPGFTGVGGGGTGGGDDKKALRDRLAKETLAADKAEAQESIRIAEEEKAEKDKILEAQYKQGLISIQDYADKKKAAALQEREDHIAAVNQEYAQEVTEEKRRLKEGEITHADYQQIIRKLDAETREKILAEMQKYGQAEKDIQAKLDDDKLSARKTYLEAAKNLEKQYLDFRKQQTEENFKKGVITASEYLSERKQQIEEEYNAAVTAAKAQFGHVANNEQEKAKVQTDLWKAQVQREKELTDITKHELDIRLQALKEQYDQGKSYLESLLSLSQSSAGQGGGGGGAASLPAISALQDINSQYIKAQEEALAKLDTTAVDYTEQWLKIATAINKAKEEQVQLNLEASKARDKLIPVANLFNDLSSSLGRFSSVLQKSLSDFARQLETLSKYREKYGSGANPLTDLFHRGAAAASTTESRAKQGMEMLSRAVGKAASDVSNFGSGTTRIVSTTDRAFQTLVAAANKAAEALNRVGNSGGGGVKPGETQGIGSLPTIAGLGSSVGIDLSAVTDEAGKSIASLGQNADKGQTGLGKFADGLGAAVGAVSTFLAGITGAKSTGGGILSGGMGGVSAGAMFGPIGMIAGGVMGAVLGGITGSKVAAAQAEVKHLKDAAKKIEDALTNGSMKLGDAIHQLQALQSEATKAAADSKDKKGGADLKAQAEALQQQIDELKRRQKELLDTMHDSIAVMSKPDQYQDLLQSLDAVINKYQEFMSAAAGSPAEVAKANQWLLMSMKQFAKQQQDDVDTAYQSAVKNAMTVIDLQQQMNELLTQENQQIADIMSRGVLTRTRTMAMTKMQEIQKVRDDTSKQRDQLQEQLTVAQDRLEKEKKIFDLAGTRIGLEAQLVKMQEAQTDKDILRIRALQDVIAKLESLTPAQMAKFDTNSDKAMQALLTFLFGSNVPVPAGGGGGGPTGGGGGGGGGGKGGGGTGVTQSDFIVTAAAQAAVSAQAQIYGMASAQASMEMAVLNARSTVIDREMQRIQAFRQLLEDVRTNFVGVTMQDLESLLSQLYGTRGRYGAGGFYRESL